MLVVTGARDCVVIIWSAEDGTRISVLDGHASPVRCLLPFYHELESGPTLQIVSGSLDSTVKVGAHSKSISIN
jgi:WD40 repeat protein